MKTNNLSNVSFKAKVNSAPFEYGYLYFISPRKRKVFDEAMVGVKKHAQNIKGTEADNIILNSKSVQNHPEKDKLITLDYFVKGDASKGHATADVEFTENREELEQILIKTIDSIKDQAYRMFKS